MDTIEAPVIGAKEPTMAELETMYLASEATPQKENTPEPTGIDTGKTGTDPAKTEPAKTPKEKTSEPEPGTGEKPQQEEADEELPEGVRKQIEREAKKQAFFQSKINQAKAARKATEAEAAKLTGSTGTEPDKTEPAKSERPKRPDLATFEGTLAEYNAAVAKADEAIEKWMEERTRETVKKELTEQQAKEARDKEWDAATKKHGADFPTLASAVAEKTPVALQAAISQLEDWSGVVVHLAKNETEHAALVEEFKANPYRAIATLGKLEDRLKPLPTAAPVKDEVKLPPPLKPVAGDAPGGHKRVDLEKASTSEMMNEFTRMLKAS